MLRAIVFDFDGVIIDSEPIHAEISMAVIRDFGGEPDLAELDEFVGVTNKDAWCALRDRHKLSGSVDRLIERYNEYEIKRFFEEPVPLVAGITDLIQSAKERGLKIALATSSPKFFAEHILKSTGLLGYFDAMVTADDITRGKPDPEIYLKAAQMLNIDPRSCIAVEDAFMGIRAARGAGMRVIGYRNPGSGNQDTSRADFVVSSILDINLDDL